VERTAVLVHLIDIAEETRTDAWKNFTASTRSSQASIRSFWTSRRSSVSTKSTCPLCGKNSKKPLRNFRKRDNAASFFAATGEGVPEILQKIATVLNQAKNDDHE
jgi:GTPase involved in cell partitioning and DNA repair